MIIVLGNLSKMYMQNRKRINRQIDWGINVCLLRKKYDNAREIRI